MCLSVYAAGTQLLRLHGGVLRRPRGPRRDRGRHPRGDLGGGCSDLGGRAVLDIFLEAGAEQPQVGRGCGEASRRQESDCEEIFILCSIGDMYFLPDS